MKNLRVNFQKAQRDIIAQRAGYRCAFPGCNALTVGAGTTNDDVEITGEAAHIYSAAKGGPRGQGTLLDDQLRAPANGIWMCGKHSDLIDKNNGERYSVTTLQSWKSLHESQVSYEHTGRRGTFGFIRRLTIIRSPLFEPNAILELAKATILVGLNGTGKTAICQWLSAVGNTRHLWRWNTTTPTLTYTILFAAPIDRTLGVSIPQAAPQIVLDGSPVSSNPIPISVTYLESSGAKLFKDDLDRFAQMLSLDPVEIQSLAAFIGSESIFLKRAEWVRENNDDGDRVTYLICTLQNGFKRHFRLLSTSEQSRVLLDFAIAKASSASRFVPAVLIVEMNSLGISWENFQVYMSLFSNSKYVFQTLITIYELPAEIERLGWQVYRIEGTSRPRKIVASSSYSSGSNDGL